MGIDGRLASHGPRGGARTPRRLEHLAVVDLTDLRGALVASSS
jgi:hypothetical protein